MNTNRQFAGEFGSFEELAILAKEYQPKFTTENYIRYAWLYRKQTLEQIQRLYTVLPFLDSELLKLITAIESDTGLFRDIEGLKNETLVMLVDVSKAYYWRHSVAVEDLYKYWKKKLQLPKSTLIRTRKPHATPFVREPEKEL
jgi:hypothetical protein